MDTQLKAAPEMTRKCACGAARGCSNIGYGYSFSGGEFRPNVERVLKAWEQAMIRWLDAPEGWWKEYVAKDVLRLHEQLLDYGVGHHSALACSLTREEADAIWAAREVDR